MTFHSATGYSILSSFLPVYVATIAGSKIADHAEYFPGRATIRLLLIKKVASLVILLRVDDQLVIL